ncbi:hypothetical protein JZX87_23435 [Agrobacterium sp. Ap1]|uniref:hypothetical protein n=1 Tax=Agrobacterium sp. Ap1 TaxID=2815337 RepID=UPI001A8F9332|nr:hypothetical protein [Agrobacterium sp. Ap1]MBO0144111.1 hypothetical protein [Agrobacterium sp. Ap1]
MSFKVKDGSQKATGATASDAVKQLEKSHGKKVVVMELIPGTNNPEAVTLSQQEIESR